MCNVCVWGHTAGSASFVAPPGHPQSPLACAHPTSIPLLLPPGTPASPPPRAEETGFPHLGGPPHLPDKPLHQIGPPQIRPQPLRVVVEPQQRPCVFPPRSHQSRIPSTPPRFESLQSLQSPPLSRNLTGPPLRRKRCATHAQSARG